MDWDDSLDRLCLDLLLKSEAEKLKGKRPPHALVATAFLGG